MRRTAQLAVVYLSFAGGLAFVASAGATTLRVVAYNVDADTGGDSGEAGGPTSGPGLTTVLRAIGNAQLANHAQPIDVLALEELYIDNTTTMSYIVSQLNGIYGTGVYAYDPTLDPTDGNFTGNGPSGLIYNTNTIQVLGATHIGVASSAGAPRAPMRYTLAPKGSDSWAGFTLYVSHAKSGSTASDKSRRDFEAGEIRDDADLLGPNAHIIYAGDFNIGSGTEDAYHTMIAPGDGQAYDPVNPANNWTATSGFKGILTESANSLRFRDDFQLISNPVRNQPGLQLVPLTYRAFGNNGTSAYRGSINVSTNTALDDLPNPDDILHDLTTATDHLPIVADYTVVPALAGDFTEDGRVDDADLAVWRTGFGAFAGSTHRQGDANGDGAVDGRDFSVWQAQLGALPAIDASSAQVPEPTSLALTFVLVLSLGRPSARVA